MKPSTLRIITIVVSVLGLIGGIVLGFKFKTIEFSHYGSVAEDFNVTLMISVWIGTVLYAIPCFALAAILENQEYITSELWKQSQAIRDLGNPEKEEKPVASNSKLNLSALAYGKNTDASWTCPKCGETNQRSSRICKSCGREK